MMDWDYNYRYKILGRPIHANGEYMLAFTSKGNPTGSLIAVPYSIQEMQEQNDKLEEALAQALEVNAD